MRWACRSGLVVLAALAGCDGSPRGATDAGMFEGGPLSLGEASVPPLYDAAGDEPFEPPDFEAGAPVPPNPAVNAFPRPDSGTPGDPGDATAPAPVVADGCLVIEPGESLRFEDRLTDAKTWRRIEATEHCPAMVVTANQVAYEPYVLCPSVETRSLEIVMRGADMLEMPPRESVANAFLAVYAFETLAHDDPYACLASSDSGMFDATIADSARIERLELQAGATAVILASSADRPDQRGVGLFELEISAR